MKSRPVAFCAMMAALSVVIMLTGGLVPVFTYCSPLISSLLLIPVLFEYGISKAWMVWFVTSVLSLLIGADKEAAFFYIFLGWYPALKPLVDRIPGKALQLIVKTIIFSAAVAAMYGLTCFVFRIGDILNSFSSSKWINIGFLAALVFVMLLYDMVLVRAAFIYRQRLLPVLSKTFKKKR
ncbi:MAG: hypothetical protein Q4F31_08760 [Eubacteriales bacterium]|nr:hypothetical protein [Eubacteriales bacterium]